MFSKMIRALFLLGLTAASQPLAAQELSVRGGFSGGWYDPDQSGHGVQIEVIDPRRAVVAWYTFSPSGERVWLYGTGKIEGNAIEAPLHIFEGGFFPPAFDPAAVSGKKWGEVTIEFTGCATAEMSWQSSFDGYDSGSMPLERLTEIQGSRCGEAETFQRSVNFSLDPGQGPWEAVFADYPVGREGFFELRSEWRRLPAPLADRHGLLISGANHSDDLAMFLKAPVEGLEPDTEYRVELAMTFATAVPRGCNVGVGGSPGSSVYVKLGAAGVEPRQFVTREGSADYYRFNIRKGTQSQGGEDARVVGNMESFQEGCPPIDQREWQLKTVNNRGENFTATTDADGTLWVYGGTDSAFEATTTYFVTDFTARLAPVSPES